MSDFVSMGGYAPFVWGSYGAGLLVFAWNLWAVHSQRVSLRRRAQADFESGQS